MATSSSMFIVPDTHFHISFNYLFQSAERDNTVLQNMIKDHAYKDVCAYIHVHSLAFYI